MKIETLFAIYLFCIFAFAIAAVVTAAVMNRSDKKLHEDWEAMTRESEAKSVQKSVPIMLRKQCD